MPYLYQGEKKQETVERVFIYFCFSRFFFIIVRVEAPLYLARVAPDRIPENYRTRRKFVESADQFDELSTPVSFFLTDEAHRLKDFKL